MKLVQLGRLTQPETPYWNWWNQFSYFRYILSLIGFFMRIFFYNIGLTTQIGKKYAWCAIILNYTNFFNFSSKYLVFRLQKYLFLDIRILQAWIKKTNNISEKKHYFGWTHKKTIGIILTGTFFLFCRRGLVPTLGPWSTLRHI